jgi:hypothetical protein
MIINTMSRDWPRYQEAAIRALGLPHSQQLVVCGPFLLYTGNGRGPAMWQCPGRQFCVRAHGQAQAGPSEAWLRWANLRGSSLRPTTQTCSAET